MLISIIVCAYNESNYLDRCLTSLAAQTCENLEIIIVNDNSWDDTDRIIEAWQKRSSLNIRVLTNPENIGLGASRNRGIKIASGDYLAFVDGDDYFLDKNYFSQMHELLQEQHPDILVTPYTREKFGILHYDAMQAEPILRKEAAGQAYLDRLYGTHGACAKFFKRSVFDAYQFSEHGFSEDVKCLFNIAMHAEKLLAVNRYGYVYFHNPKSITRKKKYRMADFYSSMRLLLEVMESCLRYYQAGIKIALQGYIKTWVQAHLPIIKSYIAQNPHGPDAAVFKPFRGIINEFAKSRQFIAYFDKTPGQAQKDGISTFNADYIKSLGAFFTSLPITKKKVVLYAPNLSLGGLQRVAADMSVALEQSGHEVVILLNDMECISYRHGGVAQRASFANIETLFHLLTCEFFVDFVYKEKRFHYAPLQFMLDNMPHKYISTLHNTESMDFYYDYTRKVLDDRHDALKYILCVSDSVKEKFIDNYASEPANLRVLPNAIDIHAISQAPAYRSKKPYALFCGRLDALRHKGVDILIKAYFESGLHKSHDLIMAGAGKLDQGLQDYCEQKNISGKIIQPGFVDNIYDYMKGADFLFQPSRWEGFCLVNVEALACGCPVLTSKAGNASGAISHGQNGYIFDLDESTSIDEGIDFILKNRQRLAEAAPIMANEYSLSAYRDKLNALLAQP